MWPLRRREAGEEVPCESQQHHLVFAEATWLSMCCSVHGESLDLNGVEKGVQRKVQKACMVCGVCWTPLFKEREPSVRSF